jgi:hypothetical protein
MCWSKLEREQWERELREEEERLDLEPKAEEEETPAEERKPELVRV